MTPKESQVSFHAWLLKNKLGDLIEKNESQIKQALGSASNERLNQHDREGAGHSFRQFLLDNCPEELRVPPIVDSKNQNMQFEEALKNIYGEFRSLFFHEGLSFASYHHSRVDDFEIGHGIISKGHYYSVDLKKIVPWLSTVVKESLYCYLIQTK